MLLKNLGISQKLAGYAVWENLSEPFKINDIKLAANPALKLCMLNSGALYDLNKYKRVPLKYKYNNDHYFFATLRSWYLLLQAFFPCAVTLNVFQEQKTAINMKRSPIMREFGSWLVCAM